MTDPAFTLIKDAVHPGADGQVIMATAIVDDLNLPRMVSSITLNVAAKGKQRSNAQGGELSDLEMSADEVSFTWKANSLPWVLPPEAQLGVKLSNLGHRLSREALTVHGLAPGRYVLTIDDVEVGTYSAPNLARHIELQANDKTPQYQQALQVALLNKERNEGPIGKLRAEWRNFQTLARTRQSVASQPDNAKAKETLAQLEQQ